MPGKYFGNMLGSLFEKCQWKDIFTPTVPTPRPPPLPPKKREEKKESNSKFDKPAGRDANLLGLRSSPEEIDVKLKCIIVEEMTFDQELCLKNV